MNKEAIFLIVSWFFVCIGAGAIQALYPKVGNFRIFGIRATTIFAALYGAYIGYKVYYSFEVPL